MCGLRLAGGCIVIRLRRGCSSFRRDGLGGLIGRRVLRFSSLRTRPAAHGSQQPCGHVLALLALQLGLQVVQRHPVLGQEQAGLFGPAERVGQCVARTGSFHQAGKFAHGGLGQALEGADAGLVEQLDGAVVDTHQRLQAVTPFSGAIVLLQQVLDGLVAGRVIGNAVGVVIDGSLAVGHIMLAGQDAPFPALHGFLAVADHRHAARQLGLGAFQRVQAAVVIHFLGTQLLATRRDFLVALVQRQAHAVQVGTAFLDGLLHAGQIVGALFHTTGLLQQLGIAAGQRGLQVGHFLFAQAQRGLTMTQLGLLGQQHAFLLGQGLGLFLRLLAPVQEVDGEFDGPADQQTKDEPTQCVHAKEPPDPCDACGTGFRWKRNGREDAGIRPPATASGR